MKKSIFLVILLFAAAQICAAATYYVDSRNGNDSNSGLSTSSPWRTLGKVNSRSFSPGDKILLKRGEIWRETLILARSSGTLSSPIMYGAYGTGAKPQINGAFRYTGWSRHSNSIYKRSFAYEPKVVVQDKKLLKFLLWKGSVYTTFAGASPGSFSCNLKTAYVWCTDSADPDAHTMEVAATRYDGTNEFGIRIKDVSNNIVQDIEVVNTTRTGIRILPSAGKTTNNITLRRLGIYNIGFSGIEVYNNSKNTTSDLELKGLVINSCVVHDTNNHGIILLYEVVGARIQFNTVYRTGWGLDASHGISSWSNNPNAYVRDCIIEGNTVYGCRSRLDSGEEGTGIHADDLTRNCLYRYNLCYNNEGSGLQFNGTSGAKYHYNISYGNGRVFRNRYRGGITLTQPVNIELYNNVCFDNSPVGFGWFGDTTNGIKIKNNILAENEEFEIRCASGAGLNVVSDYNCVYHSAGGDFMQWLGRALTWAEWKSISKQDAHSLNTNPKFISPTDKNFNLQSTSPCIDAGTNLGLPLDFDGNDVPSGVRTDIGAYEFEAGTGGGGDFDVSINASPTSGQVPLTVEFERVVSGGEIPYTYFWTFGDGGTSTKNTPSHTFNLPGNYNVVLTVTDASGTQASASQTIVATDSSSSNFDVSIYANPTSGLAPLTVYFERIVSGGEGPFTYSWTFGDGGTSTKNTPTHTFNIPGTYNVVLTVTDATGAQKIASKVIDVTDASSTNFNVDIYADLTSGKAPLTVYFERIVSGGEGPFTYSWTFGDGGTSIRNTPTHTFNTPGNYNVILVVTDSTGAQRSASKVISVSN